MSPLLLAVTLALAPSPSGEESPYPQRLLEAVAQDPEAAESLVRERPHEALAMFHFYLSACIRWELEGDRERAEYFRTFARRLAPIYDTVEGGEALRTAVTVYNEIEARHSRQKVEADGLFSAAERAYAEGSLESAADGADRALRLYEAMGDVRGQALAHHILSTLPETLRRKDLVENDLDVACRLFRTGGDAWREAEVREQRATFLHHRGYLRMALTDIQRTRSLCLRTGREESAWKARLQGAVLLLQLGRVEEGLLEVSACEDHYESSGSTAELAFARSQVAVGWISAGRYAEGIQRFQKARDLLEKAGAPVSDSARLHIQFGGAWDEVGLHDRAEHHLQLALRLAREADSVELEGSALLGLSRLELDRGESEEAWRHASQASQLGLHSAVERGRSEHLLGLALLARGESSGLERLRAATELFELVGDDLARLSCEVDTAAALLEAGQVGDAEDLFRKVLEGSGYFPEVAWRAHAGVGASRESRGETAQAIASYREAVRTLRLVALRTGVPSLRARYRGLRLSPLYRLVTLLARQGDVEGALREAQNSRTLVAAEKFASSRRKLLDRASPADARERMQLLEELEKANEALERAPRNADSAALERKLEDLRRSYEDLLLRIDLENASFGEALGILRPLDIRAVQKTLATGDAAAALVYLVTDKLVHLWTIRPGKLTHREILIAVGDLKSLLEKLRAPYARFRGGQVDLTHLAFDTRAASRLHELLVAPALRDLEGVSHVFVVPDGPLHHLPFEALVTDGQRGRVRQPLFSEYGDCHYLVERWAISYLPSLRLLEEPPRWTFQKEAEALVLADPSREALRPSQGLRVRRGGALPSAREEARAIEQALGQDKVLLLLGPQATEEGFRQHLAGKQLIHLATHAWIDDRSPLFSGVQLAADAHSDGLLEAHELLDLDLRDALILLSGCETASGPLSQGEGLESLARAFLLTGASGAVGSLWRVDDATSILMEDFYRELVAGAPPAVALQRAKIALLREKKGAGYVYALPYFWAPFVLIGAVR